MYVAVVSGNIYIGARFNEGVLFGLFYLSDLFDLFVCAVQCGYLQSSWCLVPLVSELCRSLSNTHQLNYPCGSVVSNGRFHSISSAFGNTVVSYLL